MSGYENILFDLDGTLSDSAKGIMKGAYIALQHFGIEVEDYSELYRFIGPPLVSSFSKYYGLSNEQAVEAVAVYREYYGKMGLFENELYPEIENLLKELKASGKHLFVATSKPESYSVTILEHFGIAHYFDFIGGATMDGTIGTKAKVIAHTLKNAKITDLSKTVMIGDRHHDVDGANEIGIDCIGVLYGYGNEEELKNAGAKYIAKTVQDIKKFVI